MKSVSVRELKDNPTTALKMAQEGVVVTRCHRPEAVLLHLKDGKLLDQPGVRTALAVSLYKDDSLSFGHAARLAGMVLADFMRHISPLGIPAIKGNAATLREDLTDLGAWLARPA
jgi:predicted HTH domain antitoxin